MKTTLYKTYAVPPSSLRLASSFVTSFATSALAVFRGVKRGVGVLVTEHSRALLAATKAASSRTSPIDLRAMYAGKDRETDPDALAADRNAENRSAVIQGQLLRVSERREVAIYLRKEALWVADFIDGHGALIDAATWFRFNCGTAATSYARRRMVHESAVPLSTQLVARIEGLHRTLAVHTSHESRNERSVHEC